MIFGGSGRGAATRSRAALALATMLALTGCLKPAAIEASDAWVRLPAVPGRPAVGYFTLHGGALPATLIAVNADLAQRTDMHESMAAGNGTAGTMTTMRPIRSLPLPASGTITFAPGGKHLMLFGVNPGLKPGGSTVLSFTFADGSRIERKAWALGPGDPAPN